MRICKASDCTKPVPPAKMPGQEKMYCSERCRYRESARIRRKERVKKGLCPQCGGPMDYPVSTHRKKVNPTYCSRCQSYYRERYKRKKAAK